MFITTWILINLNAIYTSPTGADQEVRHSNTDNSVPFYKRKHLITKNSIGNFAVHLDPLMRDYTTIESNL